MKIVIIDGSDLIGTKHTAYSRTRAMTRWQRRPTRA
jgi:hypothetical protein